MLAAAAFVAAVPVHAQRTPHAPLAAQLPTGARTLAMGGATAASRDAESALGNPALAGPGPITGVSLARYHEAAHGGVVGVATAVGVIGVGLGVSYLDYAAVPRPLPACPDCSGAEELNDDALFREGDGTAASLAAAFSLSATFKGFRWGAAALYLEERANVERASVAALSLGAARDVFFWGTSLGVALQNVGPSLRFAGDDVDLPMRLSVGLNKNVFPQVSWLDVSTTVGVAVRRDGFVSGSAGAEFSYVPLEGISLALRGGVRRSELRAQRPITAGLGVAVDRFALDYAWEQLREGGAHRVGLRIR
jgi:hypothetical protein